MQLSLAGCVGRGAKLDAIVPCGMRWAGREASRRQHRVAEVGLRENHVSLAFSTLKPNIRNIIGRWGGIRDQGLASIQWLCRSTKRHAADSPFGHAPRLTRAPKSERAARLYGPVGKTAVGPRRGSKKDTLRRRRATRPRPDLRCRFAVPERRPSGEIFRTVFRPERRGAFRPARGGI